MKSPVFVLLAALTLAGCGMFGGDNTGASDEKTGAASSAQSATITEGTISDAMIDLSASEGYGVTSTVDESAAIAPADVDAGKSSAKAKSGSDKKPDAEQSKPEKPKPAETPAPKSTDSDAE